MRPFPQRAFRSPHHTTTARFSDLLLAWYDAARRDLPWRAPSGTTPDPWHVVLAEVMLQQTTVATVIPYFLTFVRRWPTVHALAAEPQDVVLSAWSGLGYYRRARLLHQCAQTVVTTHDGRWPETEGALRTLPGFGAYTAAAVAAIAFGERANVVDGNVERVMARLFAVEAPLPASHATLRACAARVLPEARYGDYAQALMDLGATVCTPKRPKCSTCPVSTLCCAYALGCPSAFPKRTPKTPKPRRYGHAFVLIRAHDHAVWVRQRPKTGLLAGMWEVPSTAWEEAMRSFEGGVPDAPIVLPEPCRGWNAVPNPIIHVFTHMHLTLQVWCAVLTTDDSLRSLDRESGGMWLLPDTDNDYPLPRLTAKIIHHARCHSLSFLSITPSSQNGLGCHSDNELHH